jgi:tetratricopeptide (TPR) repeat protein
METGMSLLKDQRGAACSGASRNAIGLYDRALAEFQCYRFDPVSTVKQALAESPQFTMAHLLHAYLHLTGTEPPALELARASIERAKQLPASERERRHIAAAESLAAGEYARACDRLEDVLLDDPRDALALQVAHLFDFFRGDARSLRDRPARVLAQWSRDVPGYHAVLGMQAFGLEECGDYQRAEDRARRALELEPFDGWAHHAIAHCYEMQGRRVDGLRLMAEREQYWTADSFFALHNWWHRALFHLGLDQVERVLALYDERIRGNRSQVVLELIDASALLWRLMLRGVDVGARWQELADAWQPMVQDSFYAFNDLHALMAFVGAERWPQVDARIAALEAWVGRNGSNGTMTREVGLPLALGFAAFGRGRYAEAAERLRPVRALAYRFGGSHAQRDIVDLTLLEAARRGGNAVLARALESERVFRLAA